MARILTRALLAVALMLGACDSGATVVVDLKTDYRPGHQFLGVRVELGDIELREVRARQDAFASAGDDFLNGERVAELRDLQAGEVAVRASLLDRDGQVIATRTTILTLSGQHALTVLITSSCEGVTCPGAADDPALSACVGGRCVDPRCSPERPDLCGEPGCEVDEDCSSPVACSDGVCIASECFLRADDSRCDASELCEPQLGCVPRPGGDDAGVSCAAVESSCSDGEDDDCDGAIDCADSDCLGTPCDDGSVCTEADVCRGDGTCGGTPIQCNDGNPCTDDACDPAGGCTFTDNTAACDDGFWCNGPDRCSEGLCVAEGPAPCADFCNETTMACEECRVDADCGPVTRGEWSACSYTDGTCDETGTQTRTVSTPRCASGMCVVETTSESQGCSRDRDGVMCGSTTYTAWGGCNWAGPCDEAATQTRTRTDRRCSNGSCTARNTTESRDCTRSRPNGTSCGSNTWMRCCSGTCRDLRTNARCGACNVSCSAIGDTCASTGNGGYACRGCTTNAQCASILNSAATCYNVASPPAWCQCQCPGGGEGVCANGGCGANFYCHDCPGTNFCAPFGGSC